MFTEKIQKLANEKNITINKMAKDLGMSTGTFSTWKKRGTIPNAEIVSKIANYFNVTVDYLLEKSEQKEKPIDNNDRLTQKRQTLISKTQNFSDQEMSELLQYADFLLNKRE